jgi:cold shock CspA family protein
VHPSPAERDGALDPGPNVVAIASGTDIFVHISAVEKAGYTNLVEGAKVSYELFTGRTGKSSEENLRLG